MSADPRSAGTEVRPAMREVVGFAIVAALLIVVAISGQSIWIDEAATATYAMQEGLREFLQSFTAEWRSEAQMPLGMLLPFVFEKLLGHSEYALRLPNLLWLGLGIIAFAALGRRLGAAWLPLLLALHPMVGHYADEARPYAFQIGMSAVLLWASVGMLADEQSSSRVWWVWWIAACALCASSLMAAIVFAAWFVIFILLGWRTLRRLTGGQWAISGIMMFLMGILACYYAWTVWRGAGGAKLWSVGVSNLAFVLFEFGGFMGFSPGRIALREAGQQGAGAALIALKPYALPIALLAAVYVAMMADALRNLRRWRGNTIFLFCLITFGAGVAMVFALCLATEFPFWGRHLAPLIPVAVLALAVAHRQINSRKRLPLMIALMVLLLVSCLVQRFHPRHKKDDYRGAVTLAMEAEGEGRSLLWSANLETAEYYGYQPALHFRNFEAHADHAYVDVVFYSKGDIYDPEGRIADLLEQGRYGIIERLPAFTVWHRKALDDNLP